MNADEKRAVTLALLDLDAAVVLLEAAPLVVKEPAPSAPIIEKARSLLARAIEALAVLTVLASILVI